MIQEVIMYNAICDKCGCDFCVGEEPFEDIIDLYKYMKDNNWKIIEDKVYCEECSRNVLPSLAKSYKNNNKKLQK